MVIWWNVAFSYGYEEKKKCQWPSMYKSLCLVASKLEKTCALKHYLEDGKEDVGL